MKFILLALMILIILVILFGQLHTAHTQAQPQQQAFTKGILPSPMPNGFQKGDVNAKTTWQGKEFNNKENTGINFFNENGTTIKRYPFKTYTGKGLIDHGLEVLKLDYNLPENPLYLRLIVDELVQVSPGKYLGKLNVKLGPFAFALGFFRLTTPKN